MDNEVQYPFVGKDHNAKTAIIVRAGRKYIYLVPMKSGKLTVKKITSKQFEKSGYVALDVDVNSVVERYLAHSGGLTDTAKKELESLK